MSEPRRGHELPRARRRGLLGEETVQRPVPPGTDPEALNPYWLDEEPPEHPDPDRGCIQRGLCCRTNPGAFAPGEAEQAAALLGLTPDDFVRRYLVITTARDGEREVPTFTPVKLGRDGQPQLAPGRPVDRLYRMLRGPCVFFDGRGCRIYAARPLECRRYVCTNHPDDNLGEQELARLWLAAEAQEEPPAS